MEQWRHLCVAVFKNGFWKSARKCCKKKKLLLGYESVTLNIDFMVYIAMLRSVQTVKKENSYLVDVRNYPAGYLAECPALARPLASTIRLVELTIWYIIEL